MLGLGLFDREVQLVWCSHLQWGHVSLRDGQLEALVRLVVRRIFVIEILQHFLVSVHCQTCWRGAVHIDSFVAVVFIELAGTVLTQHLDCSVL